MKKLHSIRALTVVAMMTIGALLIFHSSNHVFIDPSIKVPVRYEVKEKEISFEDMMEERNSARVSRVQNACSSYTYLQKNISQLRSDELSHFYYNDKHKIIYCNIPKVACTNWKRMFLMLAGRNKTEVLHMGRETVHGQNYPTLIKFKQNYTALKYRMDNYLKFVVVRDPWDRITSCFRDKYENNSVNAPGFKFSAGIGSIRKHTGTKSPTFKGFAKFLLHDEFSFQRPPKYPENEHWVQFYKLCNPCAVNFDVIGKYETMNEDAKYILKKAKIPETVVTLPEKLLPHEKHSNTADKVSKYFKEIEETDIEQLKATYQEDFELFGYRENPFERNVND